MIIGDARRFAADAGADGAAFNGVDAIASGDVGDGDGAAGCRVSVLEDGAACAVISVGAGSADTPTAH
jgi:hypothetical protein